MKTHIQEIYVYSIQQIKLYSEYGIQLSIRGSALSFNKRPDVVVVILFTVYLEFFINLS